MKAKIVPSFWEIAKVQNLRSTELRKKNKNCKPALLHFLEVRCFLLEFQMGRSPNFETIS